MNWTIGLPTVSGWYWFRDRPGGYVSMVRIIRLGRVVCATAPGRSATPVDTAPPGSEWCGPLEPPI